MLLNKEKRIKYLGFNDFWFILIGIPILSFFIDYIFNNSFANYPFGEAITIWGITLLFTIANWFIMRQPIFFLRKKYNSVKDDVKRISLVFLIMVTSVWFIDFIGTWLLSNLTQAFQFFSRLRELVFIILISTMILAIYEVIYFYVRLKKSIREEEQSKQVLVQAELDGLRNQAQPHFFFNTLNTLRDIIDQNSKEDAKKFVDKLSDVYRFLLESGNANLISLRDELKFAKAYIYIQSERFGDNLKLNWNIPETSLDTKIAPMSLQLLLENAIKHNVISKAKPLEIHVTVKDYYLVVDNIIQSKSTQLPSTKVGLKNIEKRYKLISSKSVVIINEGNRFTVSLPLLKKIKE